METGWKNDVERYKRSARVHPSEEEAEKNARSFTGEVSALREKYGISDYVLMLQVYSPKGAQQLFQSAGDASNTLELAILCEDTALGQHLRYLEKDAYRRGAKTGLSLMDEPDTVVDGIPLGSTWEFTGQKWQVKMIRLNVAILSELESKDLHFATTTDMLNPSTGWKKID